MSARILDSIFQEGQVNAGATPTLDLAKGGMNGAAPSYGYRDPASGKHYGEWISATPYVRENVIPVVLTYPKFLDFVPDKEKWISALKTAMEVEAQSIDGLKSTLNIDFDEYATGGAGDQFSVPVNVKMEQSTPSFTFKERMGRPFTKLFNFWIEYGIMDSYTKRAKVLRYMRDANGNESDGSHFGGLYTPEFYSMTMLFIEPTPQFTNVEKAWLCFNMIPKNSGAVEGKRDLTANKETLEVSVEFTAITLANDAVLNLARSIMPRLTSLYMIPDYEMTLPVAGLDSALKDAKGSHSWEHNQGNGELELDTHPSAK